MLLPACTRMQPSLGNNTDQLLRIFCAWITTICFGFTAVTAVCRSLGSFCEVKSALGCEGLFYWALISWTTELFPIGLSSSKPSLCFERCGFCLSELGINGSWSFNKVKNCSLMVLYLHFKPLYWSLWESQP